MLAAERYDGAEPVNLGTGVETSIRELAETIADVTGFEGEIVWDTSMPNGQPRRSLDASRAEELFGFRARTPLRDGLERTVAWYRAHGACACGELTCSRLLERAVAAARRRRSRSSWLDGARRSALRGRRGWSFGAARARQRRAARTALRSRCAYRIGERDRRRSRSAPGRSLVWIALPWLLRRSFTRLAPYDADAARQRAAARRRPDRRTPAIPRASRSARRRSRSCSSADASRSRPPRAVACRAGRASGSRAPAASRRPVARTRSSANMAGLREYFWSQPRARSGSRSPASIAVARPLAARSARARRLACGGFVVFRGRLRWRIGVEDGELFRVLAARPLPAYALLARVAAAARADAGGAARAARPGRPELALEPQLCFSRSARAARAAARGSRSGRRASRSRSSSAAARRG